MSGIIEGPARTVAAVTGVSSYTGRYIAEELTTKGISVRGLVRRAPSVTSEYDCRRLQFDDGARLQADLEGVDVLYNTYWIRFEREGQTFAQAVANTAVLAEAAARAGVRKIVHLSVSNPSHRSRFAYFRGKAATEDAVRAAGTECTMVRPTLVFGREDILINNIAWLLRRLHAFVVAGTGQCRVQPVFVGDVATIAVREGARQGNNLLDAAGPEIYSFREFVEGLGDAVAGRNVVVGAPLSVSLAAGRALSLLLHDTVITDEELGALMAETLVSQQPATAQTKWSEWLLEHRGELGRRYTSELRRHWGRHG